MKGEYSRAIMTSYSLVGKWVVNQLNGSDITLRPSGWTVRNNHPYSITGMAARERRPISARSRTTSCWFEDPGLNPNAARRYTKKTVAISNHPSDGQEGKDAPCTDHEADQWALFFDPLTNDAENRQFTTALI
jgi:hypothetical protein